MDKSWMLENRMSKEYELGMEAFLEFGVRNGNGSGTIWCPCLKCGNCVSTEVAEVRYHLYANGIDQSYRVWFWHSEAFTAESSTNRRCNTNEEINDNDDDFFNVLNMVQNVHDQFEDVPNSFDNMFDDAKKPLSPGCKGFTKLPALVRLYNLKVIFGWSNASFSELLATIKELLPENNEIPVSMYEAKKSLTSLGLGYQKIDACPNDCCLYRKENAKNTRCPKCNLSRWKMVKNSNQEIKGIAAKQLWYFPIVPRFLRMFRNPEHSKNLCWHATDRKVDGILRHPADTPSWRLIDHLWPSFGSEPRNLRLGLSTDGINPYGDLSTKYSCWPVIITIYNLPPWLCMRRKYLLLTMLISGPKQPGYGIDVYLAPLIDDLKLLWEEGVQCIDARNQEVFTLRAVLLWTINDFPAYDKLCGCSVKGYKACPICRYDTFSIRLSHGKKNAYMGHRKYLSRHHPYRRQKKAFDGHQEHGLPPPPLSGETIYNKLREKAFHTGKRSSRGLNVINENDYWKRLSPFFELPYWKKLHVRHCLNVMHIEKNVLMNLIGTLLDIPGKSKDGLSTRLDLVELNIRPELAPVSNGSRTYIPAACYTLSRPEKMSVCKTLSDLKVPDGYSSNFRSLVSLENLTLIGLKSHDCHVLMQQLLPIALRGVLPKNVRVAIIRLCSFFNSICSKSLRIPNLDKLQANVVETLCMLEKFFPPSFFTIMVCLFVSMRACIINFSFMLDNSFSQFNSCDMSYAFKL